MSLTNQYAIHFACLFFPSCFPCAGGRTSLSLHYCIGAFVQGKSTRCDSCSHSHRVHIFDSCEMHATYGRWLGTLYLDAVQSPEYEAEVYDGIGQYRKQDRPSIQSPEKRFFHIPHFVPLSHRSIHGFPRLLRHPPRTTHQHGRCTIAQSRLTCMFIHQ